MNRSLRSIKINQSGVSSRWGHTCTATNNSEIVVFGGSGTKISGELCIFNIGRKLHYYF